MLTRKGNFKKIELETLSKPLIKDDIINFDIGSVGGGFTKTIADKICAKLTVRKDATIVIVEDLTLQMLSKLLEQGYKLENIYLAYGKWNKDGSPSKDLNAYNIMKAFIKANIKEKINIITLEEMFNMKKFDAIISNPPYGKLGDTITNNIITKLEYTDFVNLLPLKDYSLDTGKYIDFTAIDTFPPHSFSDADILTHAVKILDKPNDSIENEKDLCAAAFTVDKPMLKFMKANILREHYAIDNIKTFSDKNNVNSCFIYQLLRVLSQHTCGMDLLESKSVANEYNLNNVEIHTPTVEIKNTLFTKAGNSNYEAIQFNTVEEKKNFVEFYKVNRNFINRMIANQFIGIRDHSAAWPKVDWTKDDWTVEKILKEVANYTDEEVKAVLATMDRDWAVKDDESIERLFGEWI